MTASDLNSFATIFNAGSPGAVDLMDALLAILNHESVKSLPETAALIEKYNAAAEANFKFFCEQQQKVRDMCAEHVAANLCSHGPIHKVA